MSSDFETRLRAYAELAVKIGLNLQPGQRLIISDPRQYGVALEAAPVVRQIVAAAYRAGARRVDVIWSDDEVHLARFAHAPRESFAEYPEWLAEGLRKGAERGDAHLSLVARNPALFEHQDPELVNAFQRAAATALMPFSDYVMRDAINWLVLAAPSPAWAAMVFPDLPADQQMAAMWDAIFKICRADQPDPIAAWETHLTQLAASRDRLNQKRYTALHFRGPGTDLKIGLPEQHMWLGARMDTTTGIPFCANIPTEEVFTLPHRERIEGEVKAALPLSYAGAIIDDFSLTFEQGRIVSARAGRGEAILKSMIETDAGSVSLGEVALVPDSSPIAQSKRLFFNTLFDENAASHIAIGRAYRFNIAGGEAMSDAEFTAAGGNYSLIHVDFMIGSGAMNVDGVLPNGRTEAVMRDGEWAL